MFKVVTSCSPAAANNGQGPAEELGTRGKEMFSTKEEQYNTNSNKQSSRVNIISSRRKTVKAAGAITPVSLTVPQGLQPDLASKSITTVLQFTPFIWQYSMQTGSR